MSSAASTRPQRLGHRPLVFAPALMATAGAVLLAGPIHAAPLRAPVAAPPPTVHLTWDAPYGNARARTSKVASCSDTTRLDTLWLVFETPTRSIHHHSVSGALLFEPAAGDTLGSFWYFERGGANAGNLLIDFDLPSNDDTRSPYSGRVLGHVGFTREGSRGRLDLSANGPGARGPATERGRVYSFARVVIRHRRTDLQGCKRPMTIRWAGARFWTIVEGDLRVSPGASVTWNAPRGGIPRLRPQLAVDTWVPVEAPPSRTVIDNPRVGEPRVTISRVTPAPPDTTLPTR